MQRPCICVRSNCGHSILTKPSVLPMKQLACSLCSWGAPPACSQNLFCSWQAVTETRTSHDSVLWLLELKLWNLFSGTNLTMLTPHVGSGCPQWLFAATVGIPCQQQQWSPWNFLRLSKAKLGWAVEISHMSWTHVGNKMLPQLPQAHGGMSGQKQEERVHATERQWWRSEQSWHLQQRN